MKNKLYVKIFSSGLQAISVQVLGAFFFYFISIYLSKNDFGIVSWTNAVSIFLTTLLGFGLEQVVVRRIAASKRSDWAAAAFFFHTLIGFLVVFILLLLLVDLLKDQAGIYGMLPWFFLAQGLLYIGIPFKQFLNAKEQFTPYGVIAIISNSCKLIIAWLLLKQSALHIDIILLIMIGAAVFELICLLTYLLIKTSFSFKFQFRAYFKLLKESSSQYLSVIFDMSLSRMDWILLGIMTSSSVLADYSFAYRAYELARLPMLIMAPIILPRFARLLANNGKIDIEYRKYINLFNSTELFFAALIPLVLNILWSPVVMLITNGKYGASNSLEFLILSLCIPLQFFINLLWSLSFGAKKYRKVLYITIICAVTNVSLNLILISKFNGLGAASAFLATTLLQAELYYRMVRKEIMNVSLRPILMFTAEAVIIYFICIEIHVHFILQLLIAVAIYLTGGILSGQLTKRHLDNFKHLLSK